MVENIFFYFSFFFLTWTVDSFVWAASEGFQKKENSESHSFEETNVDLGPPHQSQGLGDVWLAGSKPAQPDIPSLAGFLAPCPQGMALVI